MSQDKLLRRAGRAALTGVLALSLACPYPSAALAETIEEMEQRISELAGEEAAARAAQGQAEAEAAAAAQAQAAIAAEVEAAQAELNALYQEAEACEYDLITITAALADTEARIGDLTTQIEATRKQLEETREDLGDIIADTYKNGRPSLLSVALSATDFDDFVARITYANKVAQYETDVIRRVEQLNAELEAAKAEQEQVRETQAQQKAEQEQRKAALDAAVASLEAYQAQLGEEILAKIAEAEAAQRQASIEAARAQAAAEERVATEAAKTAAEEEQRRAAEEARRAEEEARRAAEAEAAAAAAAARSEQGEASSATETTHATTGGEGGELGESSGASESVTPSSPHSASDAAALVSACSSIIGSGYSWSGYHWTGSTSDSWFTCSGIVDFALGREPHSSSPETLYAEVGSSLVFDTSQLQYGDLVFYTYAGRHPGHVGVYIGGGQIIDAVPGGVGYHDVNFMNFIGGGPIV